MLTTLRIAAMIKSLDEGHGVRLSVSTLDEKCVYSHEMAHDEAFEVQAALEGFGADCPGCVEADALVYQHQTERESAFDALSEAEDENSRAQFSIKCQAESIDGLLTERNAARARYEAEKLSHGETQRSLMTAVCRAQDAEKERDTWRTVNGELRGVVESLRSDVLALQNRATAAEANVGILRADRAAFEDRAQTEAANARHAKEDVAALTAKLAELQAGEPVAWRVDQPGHTPVFFEDGPYARGFASNSKSRALTPLYAAPPKAETAFGVSDERFASVRTTPSGFAVFGSDFTGREVVSRDEANRLNETPVVPGDVREVVRIIPVDAPVVDVAAIRETCGTGLEWLSRYGKDGMNVRQFLERILAAIGEKVEG